MFLEATTHLTHIKEFSGKGLENCKEAASNYSALALPPENFSKKISMLALLGLIPHSPHQVKPCLHKSLHFLTKCILKKIPILSFMWTDIQIYKRL